jgi:hypothetical protein
MHRRGSEADDGRPQTVLTEEFHRLSGSEGSDDEGEAVPKPRVRRRDRIKRFLKGGKTLTSEERARRVAAEAETQKQRTKLERLKKEAKEAAALEERRQEAKASFWQRPFW